MFELAKVGGYLVSPLTLSLGLGLLAAIWWWRRRSLWAARFALTGFVLLWIASTPWVDRVLIGALERRYPAIPVERSPSADAILVLGGALVAPKPPERPQFLLGAGAGRVWHAAALYRAGKARWVVVTGGNQPEQQDLQPESEVIAEMLVRLGVPAAAIRTETASRNTRENARNVRPVLDKLGVRSALLVTSAQHMPRAVRTFAKVWPDGKITLIPNSTDVQVTEEQLTWNLWLPSLEALNNVSKAVKEIAGLLALAII